MGLGDQVPALAVSFLPTFAVPVIFGVGAFVNALTTLAVALEVLVTVV